MTFKDVVEAVGKGVDGAGVVVIIAGILLTTFRFLSRPHMAGEDRYRQYRQGIGQALLLGLELLVAGDIIRTVAVKPTLTSVSVLGVIVIIRTFLSWSLEVELSGRWPWQQHNTPS